MSEHEPLKHEFDGIREEDNPMPRWWLLTFYGTVVFGAVYYVAAQFFGAFSIEDEYRVALARRDVIVARQEREAAAGELAKRLDDMVKDPRAVAGGHATYDERCAMCHGPEGQGLIGPNLTDDAWKNGDGRMPALVKVIREGVDGKGMQAWQGVLKENELYAVAAYVRTLRGTSPKNAKNPEGVVYAP